MERWMNEVHTWFTLMKMISDRREQMEEVFCFFLPQKCGQLFLCLSHRSICPVWQTQIITDSTSNAIAVRNIFSRCIMNSVVLEPKWSDLKRSQHSHYCLRTELNVWEQNLFSENRTYCNSYGHVGLDVGQILSKQLRRVEGWRIWHMRLTIWPLPYVS